MAAILVLNARYISCLDDSSRKAASKWSERKRTIDVLDVLEEWIVINGKPKKVKRDNGKQFTSKIFKLMMGFHSTGQLFRPPSQKIPNLNFYSP